MIRELYRFKVVKFCTCSKLIKTISGFAINTKIIAVTSAHCCFEMATVDDNSVSSDSSSDIDLHMSFEISSFEEEDEEHQQNIVPYRFEPEASSSSESDGSNEDEVGDQHRLGNTDWYDFPHLSFVIRGIIFL